MSIAKLIIDLLGVSFAIYLITIFYKIFWDLKPLKKSVYFAGLFGLIIFNTVAVTFVKSDLLTLAVSVLIAFLVTLFFDSGIISKILFSLIMITLAATSEMIVVLIIRKVLGISIAYIQNNMIAYAVALFSAKSITLSLIYIAKFIIPPKGAKLSKKFNLIMLLLPGQSLALCFIILGITPHINDIRVSILSMLALFVSFLLIVIVAFIIKTQLETMEYKQKYELAQVRLKEQIKHYNELYLTEREVRGIRHDIKNNLIVISSLLKKHNIKDAIKHIEKIQEDIKITDRVINTGFPAIDAILNAKTNEAAAQKIDIYYKISIEGELFIDQFDIVTILANALDNAIEALVKSENVNMRIEASICSQADYISIVVENYTSETIDRDLKTTKEDKANHGFGIRQMKAAVDKYDGSLLVGADPKTQKFSVAALLKNTKI